MLEQPSVFGEGKGKGNGNGKGKGKGKGKGNVKGNGKEDKPWQTEHEYCVLRGDENTGHWPVLLCARTSACAKTHIRSVIDLPLNG